MRVTSKKAKESGIPGHRWILIDGEVVGQCFIRGYYRYEFYPVKDAPLMGGSFTARRLKDVKAFVEESYDGEIGRSRRNRSGHSDQDRSGRSKNQRSKQDARQKTNASFKKRSQYHPEVPERVRRIVGSLKMKTPENNCFEGEILAARNKLRDLESKYNFVTM